MKRTLIWYTSVAALGSFLFGFDTAVISGATNALRAIFGLTGGQLGFTVASALIGTIAGALFIGKPADIFGRKMVLFALAVLYLISSLGCAFAWSWYSFLLFRFLGGLAIGGASVVSPMYIAEIAPANLRGRLVGISQFNVVIGILAAYFSNYIIGSHTGNEFVAWRWMFGIPAFPSVLFFIFVFTIPNSPRWLVKRRRNEEAVAIFRKVGEENPEQLVNEIVESLHEDKISANEPFFCKKYMQPILLVFMVATFNQLSGINALIYYTADIFKMAGAGNASALLQSVIIGFTNLVFTIVAMTVIDKFGRKKLLLTGSVGLALCLGTVAYAFYNHIGGKFVLICLIAYIAFFAFSQGAVIWVFISEIFPNRVRSRGQAFGSFVHWFWCAAVSWSFPVIAGISGGHAFAFFAAMMILQFFMVLKFLPETKGISLEVIQKKLGIE